jgi:hypothetical protein
MFTHTINEPIGNLADPKKVIKGFPDPGIRIRDSAKATSQIRLGVKSINPVVKVGYCF